jgi:hypothetical protein
VHWLYIFLDKIFVSIYAAYGVFLPNFGGTITSYPWRTAMPIYWKPEINALTKPRSYRPRFIPRGVSDNDKIAVRMEQKNPLYTTTLTKSFLIDLAEVIYEEMLDGNVVAIAKLFFGHVDLTGRLENAEDDLQPLEKCLRTRFTPAKELNERLQNNAHTERKPADTKLPQINTAFDALLNLDDVLNPVGLLQINGENLFFDRYDGISECVLEGTREGRTVQTRFTRITAGEIQFMPDIPSQTEPWNNEYTLSLTTHYTERGTLRTGSYARMLRTPLDVRIGSNPGILSTGGTSPLVTVSGGSLSAEGARVRIQVLHDVQDDLLLFSLIDMQDGGHEGNEVQVAANGVYTIPGYSGGHVTSLIVTVADYATFYTLVRNTYGGRIVDILDVSVGT